MKVASELEVRSLPWLLSLENDAVTFGTDSKTEYDV